MGGNITKDGITKDLEAMKAHGVVQATIFNIGEIYTKKVDVPKVKFNSPEWIEMYQWALKEASRLGITIGIQTIDGFATSRRLMDNTRVVYETIRVDKNFGRRRKRSER